MKGNQHIRSILALFQAALFCLIVVSGTVFMHKHKTADGRIVIHIHPYNLKNDGDATKHHHSQSEIRLLDVVFQGSFIATSFTPYDQPIFTPVCVVYHEYFAIGKQADPFPSVYLRGPPPRLV